MARSEWILLRGHLDIVGLLTTVFIGRFLNKVFQEPPNWRRRTAGRVTPRLNQLDVDVESRQKRSCETQRKDCRQAPITQWRGVTQERTAQSWQ